MWHSAASAHQPSVVSIVRRCNSTPPRITSAGGGVEVCSETFISRRIVSRACFADTLSAGFLATMPCSG
jgi:hypothetical protein